MSRPYQTGFKSEDLLAHHVLRGTVDGMAEMQVSPVSMLQYTFIASSTHPWLGSIQYSPAKNIRSDSITLQRFLKQLGRHKQKYVAAVQNRPVRKPMLDTRQPQTAHSTGCEHAPLLLDGWHSFRSSQVRAGCFLEPSGLRMVSIWLLRDFSVAWTPGSVLLWSSGAASSSVNSGSGSAIASS